MVISENDFTNVKKLLNRTNGVSVAGIAKMVDLSETSVYRIKKSKDYNDFKYNLLQDRGKKYWGKEPKKSFWQRIFGGK